MPDVYTAALVVAAISAMARFPAVVYVWLRTFLARKRFVSFHFGWVEFLPNFEPVVLLIVGYLLLRTLESRSAPSAPQALAATLGAVFGLLGWAFQGWALLSWTSLFAGHGVLENQRLLTRGAYAVVRHPAYLGIILVWLGLALAFLSLGVLALTIVYTIPIFVLYIRREEEMMLGSFGDEYLNYRRRVPMLIPHLRSRSSRGRAAA
jgi:protein-S-isoprenylcysteine O-methyltransferase Ste14